MKKGFIEISTVLCACIILVVSMLTMNAYVEQNDETTDVSVERVEDVLDLVYEEIYGG